MDEILLYTYNYIHHPYGVERVIRRITSADVNLERLSDRILLQQIDENSKNR